MTAARDCQERFPDLVALVLDQLEPGAAQELQRHLGHCGQCQAAYEALLVEEREVRLGFEVLARNLGRVGQRLRERLQAWHGPSGRSAGSFDTSFFERVMTMMRAHRRLSTAAAAVLTALAASLILYVFLFSASTPAYALEQTAQANERLTSYHMKVTPAPEPPTRALREAWVQLEPDGTPRLARIEVSDPDRGVRVIIVGKDRVEILSKTSNFHVVSDNKELIAKGLKECQQFRPLFDPKLAFERLQADKASGKVTVETQEPRKEGDPIQLTVTSKENPEKREIYEVDPKTKLVARVRECRRQGKDWPQVSQRDYLDYNRPIDPSVFQLEVPQGTTTLDPAKMTPDKIGLSQGQLSEEEIVTKLARENFEAMIAGDWKKVSQLNAGIPAEVFQKDLERRQLKVLRIVEVGKPTKIDDPRWTLPLLEVSVKVEVEKQGQKTVEDWPLRVYRVDRNLDRWAIHN